MGAKAAFAPLALALHRGIRALAPPPAGSFRILLFHDVAESDRPAFTALVEGLVRRDALIGPAEAAARLAGGGGAPAWLFSFDDGFASNAQVAHGILDRLGVKALFFVCPGLVDLSAGERPGAVAANVFSGQRAASEVPDLMDWSTLEGLRAAGHEVASHTLSHLRLAGLSAEQLAEQVGEAARRLSARLGASDWFAYTFGDVESIDSSALAEIARHHRFCRSGVRGPNGPAIPPLGLRADSVTLAASPVWRALEVEGGLDLHYRRAAARLDGWASAFPLPQDGKLGKASRS